MPTFPAFDGTPLSYRVHGTEGDPVVCVPGGPTGSAYLGDLGGLSARRRLCVLDLRGTGASDVPEDTGSYRCDRMAEDVEALRAHLGLDRMDLLAHSAGGVRALLLAGEYDLNSPPPAVAAFAKLFGEAVFLVQPGTGHYPWLDDAGLFVRATAAFLG
ncbi:alpha/beta hydrolase [Streptomyces sp. NPDC049954]|uniref:alpha/beta fold hydrolase n=1 Tax=Streptomyces sp. NPDC049954 TaxID=3155779 RepID=UPI0034468132